MLTAFLNLGSNTHYYTNETESSITVNATIITNSSECVKLDCTIMDIANDTDQCVALFLKYSHMSSNYGLLNFTIHQFNNWSGDSATLEVCLPQDFDVSDLIIDVFLFSNNKIITIQPNIPLVQGMNNILCKINGFSFIIIFKS